MDTINFMRLYDREKRPEPKQKRKQESKNVATKRRLDDALFQKTLSDIDNFFGDLS